MESEPQVDGSSRDGSLGEFLKSRWVCWPGFENYFRCADTLAEAPAAQHRLAAEAGVPAPQVLMRDAAALPWAVLGSRELARSSLLLGGLRLCLSPVAFVCVRRREQSSGCSPCRRSISRVGYTQLDVSSGRDTHEPAGAPWGQAKT